MTRMKQDIEHQLQNSEDHSHSTMKNTTEKTNCKLLSYQTEERGISLTC